MPVTVKTLEETSRKQADEGVDGSSTSQLCSIQERERVNQGQSNNGNNLPPLQPGYEILKPESESDVSISDSSNGSAQLSTTDGDADEESAGASSSSVDSTSDNSGDMENNDVSLPMSSSESSLSNYADCASSRNDSSGEDDFQSLDETSDEVQLLPVPGDGEEAIRTTADSNNSDLHNCHNLAVSSASSSFAFDNDSESASSVEEFGNNMAPQNLSSIVERENRKNIVKTLQGQAEIITNWSLGTRPSDGRQMWMLMEGKPYTYAYRLHHNNRPAPTTVAAGCSRSNMTMGCASLSSRLEALALRHRDNLDNDLSRVSSGFGLSRSAACLMNEASPLLDGSTVEYVEDTSSGSESSLDEIITSTLEVMPTATLEEVPAATLEEIPKKKHNKKGLHPCGRCAMFLINKFYWYKHVIKQHGRQERAENLYVLYDCNYCSKQFGLKKSRDAHQKTHVLRIAVNAQTN